MIGTAVRRRGTVAAGTPFLTALGGGDFAALVRGGWLPVTIVLSMVRWTTGYAGTLGTGSITGIGSTMYPTIELDGLTQLQVRARAQARDQLDTQLRRVAAGGMLLHELDVRWEREDARYDVEVEMLGTAIVRAPAPLSVRQAAARLEIMPVIRLDREGSV